MGCAGSVPGPDAACSCYLVEADGYRLLLDLGVGAVGPLQRYAAPSTVDAAFITHAHGDHYYDLWSLAYLRERAGVTDPLPVYGPQRVAAQFPDVSEMSFEPVPDKAGPWRMRWAVADHPEENWAVRLDDALCYTGDSHPCAALDDLADGCAVLLAEAAEFDSGRRSGGHLSAGDAGRLAARSGARVLVLTHLRSWQDHGALLAEAAREADCPVLLATPGLTMSI